MRIWTAAVVLSLAIGGCTPAPPTPAGNGYFVSAVGTPLYIAFKIPVCAVTIGFAAPIAGVAGLAGPSENYAAHDARPELDDALTRNCGPPYVLVP